MAVQMTETEAQRARRVARIDLAHSTDELIVEARRLAADLGEVLNLIESALYININERTERGREDAGRMLAEVFSPESDLGEQTDSRFHLGWDVRRAWNAAMLYRESAAQLTGEGES